MRSAMEDVCDVLVSDQTCGAPRSENALGLKRAQRLVASVLATFACFGAVSAVLVLVAMTAALLFAYLTRLRARGEHGTQCLLGLPRLSCHNPCSGGADVGAIEVSSNAVGHRHVCIFLDAGIRADSACGHTLEAGIDTGSKRCG